MRKEFVILAGVIVLVIVAFIVGSNYYKRTIQNERKAVNTATNTAPAGQLVRPDSPTLGPADAKVTLVEFYDPECEACAQFGPIVKKFLKEYDGRLRLVARYMPLHPNSMTAATFIEAAAEQGKYWEAQALLFEKQPEWGEKHGEPDAKATPINVLFDGYAKQLGLDLSKARAAIEARSFDAKIAQDKKDGQNLGVRKTPTFFVNGRELMRFSEAELRQLIDEELKK